MSALNHT